MLNSCVVRCSSIPEESGDACEPKWLLMDPIRRDALERGFYQPSISALDCRKGLKLEGRIPRLEPVLHGQLQSGPARGCTLSGKRDLAPPMLVCVASGEIIDHTRVRDRDNIQLPSP